MRFIDLEELEPLIQHLIPELEEAQRKVCEEQDTKARRELIEQYRGRWVQLRPYLEKLSDNKCWYVECSNPGTDEDVDHFRPKGRVHGEVSHPGYYWLAFDWQNFRLSCHRSNRLRRDNVTGVVGGKADYFPLVTPANRAYSPSDDLSLEDPAILDPTNPEDPPLLSFKSNGETDISPEFKGVLVAEERIRRTRLCLHLDWPKFRDERVVLYNTIRRTVRRGDRCAPKPGERGSSQFIDIVRDLKRLMRKDADYSAAAKVYIESFKDRWWIEMVVLKGGV